MSKSGSENRARQITLKARFNEQEAALIKEQAQRAGVSVAAVLRYAVLGQTPLRASRTPPLDKQLAAQLLAQLGQCAEALREAADHLEDDSSNHAPRDAQIKAAHRDLADMRSALFEALGRAP